jgi:hypothetical protein
MRYFKRQTHHYLKLDDEKKVVTELFGSLETQRIQVLKNEASYNAFLSQVNTGIFKETTEADFYEVVGKLIPFLNDL